MTRDDAWALVLEHTPSESLRKHMLAVEAAMAWYARRLSEDEERWRVTGLLHDFDYEAHPTEHPYWGVAYLRERGVDEETLEAIMGHGTFTGVARVTPMARTLFAVDELTGLITAAVYVRPDRSIHALEVPSILKKFKDKAFAKGVNRDDIRLGVSELGTDLETHVANVLDAMRQNADALGLSGP
jgi:putative nucleotidyltransferase with HDIG domain